MTNSFAVIKTIFKGVNVIMFITLDFYYLSTLFECGTVEDNLSKCWTS